MKLENKKQLVAKVLKIGKGRVIFNTTRLNEIKEAITRQDIKDLTSTGAILVKEKAGRRKIVKRKTRRRVGSVKKKVNTRKKDYILLTRKLRAYLKNLKEKGKMTNEEFIQLRKEIRAKSFRSLAHMKEKIHEEKK